MEQTPEAANSAPGFLPALTHFTGAVDAFPKEMIKHFSLFKEVEAKLFDPEHMLKELLDQIAQLPVTTRGQLPSTESSAGVDSNASVSPMAVSATTRSSPPAGLPSSPRQCLT